MRTLEQIKAEIEVSASPEYGGVRFEGAYVAPNSCLIEDIMYAKKINQELEELYGKTKELS